MKKECKIKRSNSNAIGMREMKALKRHNLEFSSLPRVAYKIILSNTNKTGIFKHASVISRVVFDGCVFNMQGPSLITFTNVEFKNCFFKNMIFSFCTFVNCTFNECIFKNIRITKCKYYGNTMFNGCLYKNFVCDKKLACPPTGSFIGYKVCVDGNDLDKTCIVKLEIPEDAKRSSAFSNKCRCSKAKVLEILEEDDYYHTKTSSISEALSLTDNFEALSYRLGDEIVPDKWDNCRWNECSNGIHFFMTEKEAIDFIRNTKGEL